MSIIVLDSTTKSLKVNLSGAVANTNPSFVVTFADTTATAFTEASSDGVLNGTSNVTVVAAPAIATRRVIKNLIIKNNDTAAVTVNLFLDNNGTSRNIARVTLAVDDTWTLSGTFSSNGSLKQTLGTNNLDLTGTTSAQALTVSGATTLSAGTANGVLYLNGSKVATTGSALTFNGSTVGVTAELDIKAANNLLFLNSDNSNYIFLNNPAGSGANIGQLAFTLGGVGELMRLTSTGLGIGTSSPSYNLDVVQNVDSASGGIRVTNSNAGTSAGAVLRFGTDQGNIGFVRANSSANTGAIGGASAVVIGNGLAFPVVVATNGVARATFDSSGNLGLGVTPSAWSSSQRTLQIGNTASVYNASSGAFVGNNLYNDSTPTSRYLTTNFATAYGQSSSGQHQWFTAPSGTAGNAITFTQAMTLDASGNLGIGTTSPAQALHVVSTGNQIKYPLRLQNDGTSGTTLGVGLQYYVYNGTSVANLGAIIGTGSTWSYGTYSANQMSISSSGSGGVRVATASAPITFHTGNADSDLSTERARITSGGNLLVGATAASYGMRMRVDGGIASTGSVQFNIDGTAATDFEWVLRLGSGMRFYVNNASVLATLTSSGVWTNASDARYKENIRPVTYGLAEVMQLQPRAYNIIGSEKQEIGFVAQEVEPFIPELVESSRNSVTEEERLTLSYGQMSAVLVKAIQEQQALITSLTARVAALEGTQP